MRLTTARLLQESGYPVTIYTAALPETLIFNCTGLGSKALFDDDEMQPLRGQLEILLPQPEVDYAVSAPDGLYMFSRTDGITLGGTTDRRETSTRPDLEKGQAIIDGHKDIFGKFKCEPAQAGPLSIASVQTGYP